MISSAISARMSMVRSSIVILRSLISVTGLVTPVVSGAFIIMAISAMVPRAGIRGSVVMV